MRRVMFFRLPRGFVTSLPPLIGRALRVASLVVVDERLILLLCLGFVRVMILAAASARRFLNRIGARIVGVASVDGSSVGDNAASVVDTVGTGVVLRHGFGGAPEAKSAVEPLRLGWVDGMATTATRRVPAGVGAVVARESVGGDATARDGRPVNNFCGAATVRLAFTCTARVR
jgi:hypothetical protein